MALLLFAAAGWGQAPTPALFTALEGVATSGRGVALALEDAPLARRFGEWPPLPEAPPGGFTLADIAAHFERTIVRTGRVTALAPETMFVLRPREEIRFPNPDAAGMALLASLNPAQQRLLLGAQGLGWSDLNAAQRRDFLALLPDPICLIPAGRGMTELQKRQVPPVSPEERRAVRLQIFRYLSVSHFRVDDNQVISGISESPRYDWEAAQIEAERDQPLHGGAVQIVANRLKPGDLSFTTAAMEAGVSLDGVKTVGDLVERCAQASERELYADARLARLRLWRRGESASAGELLRALCQMVTGTFRRVADETGDAAFVLTDDREGLGARQTLLQRLRNRAAAEQADGKWREAVKKSGLLERAPFDYPFEVPEALVKKIDAGVRQEMAASVQGRREPAYFPTVDLPPAVREMAMRGVAEYNKIPSEDGGRLLREDRVRLGIDWRARLRLPDGTTASIDRISFSGFGPQGESPKPPSSVPRLPAARGVLIAPRSVGECRAMVEAAREAGLAAVWVDVPTRLGAAKPLLDAAIAAAGGKLSVVAQVRLLHPRRDEIPDSALPDRNILGETSDVDAARSAFTFSLFAKDRVYLAPTSETQQRVTTEIAAIAKVPGLAGLALRDDRPPPNTLGYTIGNRLAFLCHAHVDPIDLGTNETSTTPPYFFSVQSQVVLQTPDGGVRFVEPETPGKAWREWQERLLAPLRPTLFSTVRAAAPDLPLWIAPEGVERFAFWMGIWERLSARPGPMPEIGGPAQQLLQPARAFSRTVWRLESFPPPRPGPEAAWLSYFYPTEGDNWDGVVFDLADRTLPQLTEWLAAWKGAK